MKTAICIVTKRAGGIDIIDGDIFRQLDQDFSLYVIDELERDDWWRRIDKQATVIKPPYMGKRPRNLARCYNLMAEYMINDGIDLFISLQDYIWIPSDGVHRFKLAYEKFGDKNLYTGLTSISSDPGVDEIHDLDDNYTIFKEPYGDKPKIINWHDARDGFYGEIGMSDETRIITLVDPNHFEMNWAAIPVQLFRDGLLWDEEYDEGVACENNKLALDLIVKHDGFIVLDRDNHAISLPHREYFDEGEIGSDANHKNLEKFHQELQEAKRSVS